MDVGVFIRSRSRLRFWLLMPPALMIVVAMAGAWYVGQIEGQIEWRREFLQAAPELRAAVASARDSIRKNFLVFRNNEEARDQLNGVIIERARAVEFTINSMGIDESPPGSGTLRIVVHGEGTLVAVMEFANEIQRSENLLTLDICSLQLLRRQAGLSYTADFVFRHASQTKKQGRLE